ncbi:MAG TPA: Maf family protein [Clostridia bacterium]|nr:Maf family protein [Clostridia bacterium]
MQLVLASGSARRRELMELAGYDFTVRVSDADETADISDPALLVRELALKKALAVRRELDSLCCVIGADTVVVIGGTIIGKPKDESDAFHILKALSNRTHTVYTGLCVAYGLDEPEVFSDATRVTFMDLSDEEIWRYIKTGDPMDKAGAYGVQGAGCVLVKSVTGCYFTVIGLPMPLLYKSLREKGIMPTRAKAK